MSRAAERGVRAAGPGDAATPVATPAATDAATHAATDASTDPEAHRWGTVARVVAASPESLAAAVAGFSIGPMILLLLGRI